MRVVAAPVNVLTGACFFLTLWTGTLGYFFVGMKKGTFEGMKYGRRFNEEPRFFALYEKEEFQKILKKHFKIVHYSEIKVNETHVYLNFLCGKKD